MSFDTLWIGLYAATLCALGLFGLHRVWLAFALRWRPTPIHGLAEEALPFVTVQLPLYNERTVAARVIRAAAALDYPADRLEIQVLDDSDDETRAVVAAEVAELERRGSRIEVLHRSNRAGFKAGALEHGLVSARGEFVAVFDADFVPRPDFLRALVPAFADERVGMVQARWDHLNRDESLLTRAQSALLDGHFVIEHTVRFQNGLFFNFNGTAGIWRRAAIDDAGGWHHDTLTEDLDLSYRAQLRGWRFVYAPQVTVLAEVPAELAAFRSQQYRWAKGSVQVARKLAATIARAELPGRIKLESAAHLTSNCGYPFVVLLAVLLPRVATAQESFNAWAHLAAFLACTLSVIAFYARAERAAGRSVRQCLVDVPAALALGIGMSIAQTRAVIAGLFGRTGEFVRTPKRGDAPATARYRSALRAWPVAELLFAAWSAWGLYESARAGAWGSLPFQTLFFAGFAWTGGLALRTGARRAVPLRHSVDNPASAWLAREGASG